MVPTKIVRLAHKEALKSLYRFKIGAVIYDGKKIVGRGFNRPEKTHPKSPAPYKNFHAEFSSLLDARFKGRGLSIYVHRIRRDGKIGLAKPCSCCQLILKLYGVKEIYFSNDEETISQAVF